MTSNLSTMTLGSRSAAPGGASFTPPKRGRTPEIVFAAVIVVHALGLYWITHQKASVVLSSAASTPGANSVAVELVTRQPTPEVQPPKPVPPVQKPVEKPKPEPVERPKAKEPPKLATKSASTHEVAIAEPVEQRPAPKPVQPAPAEPAPSAPTQPSAPAQASAGDNRPTLATKTISSGDMSRLGCQIPRPNYPSKAKRLGQEGVVTLKVTIAVDGKISRARVVQSSGYPTLDDAAVEALQAGRCQPYMEGGQPMQVDAAQPIAFHLND
ncbi:TonB family protein [Cupriavidus necator]